MLTDILYEDLNAQSGYIKPCKTLSKYMPIQFHKYCINKCEMVICFNCFIVFNYQQQQKKK